MSLLRALRAYVGLGPDDDIEGDYLSDLDDPRPTVDPAAEQSGDPRKRGERPAGRSSERSSGGRNVHHRSSASVRDGESEGQRSVGPSERSSNSKPSRPEAESRPDQTSPARRSRPARTRSDQSGAERPGDSRSGGGAERSEPEGPPTDGIRVRDRDNSASTAQGEAVVHSLDSVRAKPKTMVPESFSDAKNMADDFKLGSPIVLNLQGVDRELARRLIDFASGLCYGLDGSMEKIASQVFLVVPAGAEVRDEDRDRIKQRGYAR